MAIDATTVVGGGVSVNATLKQWRDAMDEAERGVDLTYPPHLTDDQARAFLAWLFSACPYVGDGIVDVGDFPDGQLVTIAHAWLALSGAHGREGDDGA